MPGTQTELRIPAPYFQQLQDHLLQDENERIAIAHSTQSGTALLVHNLDVVPDADLKLKETGACRLTNEAERRRIGACTKHEKHPVIIHSHPFAETAWFSSDDEDMMQAYQDWLGPLFPDTAFAFGVLSQAAFRCKQWNTEAETFNELPVRVLGVWSLDTPVQTVSQNGMDVDTDRYDRSIRVLGDHGQRALADSHVAVVGCGGIGSWVAPALAREGVSQLTLIDPDRIERSNLPRLCGACEADVGDSKVAVTAEQCRIANPSCAVTTAFQPVQKTEDLLKDVEVIIAGLDKVTPRYWLNEFAVQHLIPYVDLGTRIDVDDENRIDQTISVIQTVVPGVTECIDCDEYFDPEIARVEQLSGEELAAEIQRGYVEADVMVPEPSILDVNLVAVSLGLGVVKRLLTGGPTPPPALLQIEHTGYEIQRLRTHARNSCLTCGEDGILGLGDHEPPLDLEQSTPPVQSPGVDHQIAEGITIPDSATASFSTNSG